MPGRVANLLIATLQHQRYENSLQHVNYFGTPKIKKESLSRKNSKNPQMIRKLCFLSFHFLLRKDGLQNLLINTISLVAG